MLFLLVETAKYDMTKYYTYLYTDPSRDEPIYVGKGKKDRALVHLKRKGMHPLIQRLAKMKRNGVDPIISLIHEGCTEKQALAFEIFWIAAYGRKDLKKGPLLNLTDGGEGVSGLKQITSIETRMKLSIANKGHSVSTETRIKISTTKKGHIHSLKAKAKIRNTLNKPCTVDGSTIYISQMALQAALGQGLKGTRSPNFRYINTVT